MALLNKYDPRLHHRRSIRLKGYDYTRPGFYFITLNTHKSKCIFGQIVNGKIILNEFGLLVDFTWNDLPNHNRHVRLDAYVIMPDHFHGIIELKGHDEKTACAIRHPLSEIIRQFKTFSARRINLLTKLESGRVGNDYSSERVQNPPRQLWQRDYYERIIRNTVQLNTVRRYIHDNPKKYRK